MSEEDMTTSESFFKGLKISRFPEDFKIKPIPADIPTLEFKKIDYPKHWIHSRPKQKAKKEEK